MGTLGPNNAATLANDSLLGLIAMSNPTNAQLSDDAYVTAVLALGQTSQYLKATGFNFTIPLDAMITGITVEVERSATALSALSDSSVRLVQGGVISGDNKAAAGTWPTTDTYQTYGSATDLWGLSLTPADINASNFGVVFSAAAALAATLQIDHIRITVSYLGSNRAVQTRWPRTQMSISGRML